MNDPKQGYRDKHEQACMQAFEGFELDLSSSNKPEQVMTVRDLAAQGYYSKEIAELIGITPKAVQKIFRRYNFPSLHNICPPQMEERHDWKHGQKMMKGYVYQRSPAHPNGTKQGNYVALHRLVMEKTLGRFLLPKEVVDHIDGDITNNDPGNLRVFQSNADHLRHTLKGRCPKWSKEGLERLSQSRQRQSDRASQSSRD